jgi:hypothetical protein
LAANRINIGSALHAEPDPYGRTIFQSMERSSYKLVVFKELHNTHLNTFFAFSCIN